MRTTVVRTTVVGDTELRSKPPQRSPSRRGGNTQTCLRPNVYIRKKTRSLEPKPRAYGRDKAWDELRLVSEVRSRSGTGSPRSSRSLQLDTLRLSRGFGQSPSSVGGTRPVGSIVRPQDLLAIGGPFVGGQRRWTSASRSSQTRETTSFGGTDVPSRRRRPRRAWPNVVRYEIWTRRRSRSLRVSRCLLVLIESRVVGGRRNYALLGVRKCLSRRTLTRSLCNDHGLQSSQKPLVVSSPHSARIRASDSCASTADTTDARPGSRNRPPSCRQDAQ